MPKVGNATRRHFRQHRGKYHRSEYSNVSMEVNDDEIVIRIDLTHEGEGKTVKTHRGDEDLIATTNGWKQVPGHPDMHVSVRACKEQQINYGEDN